jgi:Gpi18-like mannosyltransferase
MQAAAPTSSRRSALADLRTIALLFLAWRGLLFAVDYAGRGFSKPIEATRLHPVPFWDGYCRFDAGWLSSVGERGYYREPTGWFQGKSANAAFFPLYPYAVRILAAIRLPGGSALFDSHWTAGLVLSNVAFFFALYYVLQIARTGLDEDGARRSILYLLACPTSFFFSSYYTESLFLLTTSASVHHFLGGRYARCGAWGMLAAMTRSPGIVLLPALLIGHLWVRRGRLTQVDRSLLWLGLIPAGLLVVMGVMWYQLGDPLAFSQAHAFWKRSYTWPHTTLWNAFKGINWSLPLGDRGDMTWAMELLSSLVFLALPLAIPSGFHKALPALALGLVLMPLSTGHVMSMMRCEVVAFPAFFALARFGSNRGFDRLFLFGSGLFLSVFKIAFANWYFLG